VSIADNLLRIRELIACAAEKSGRNPGSIKLVAVTKTVDAARIQEAIEAGVTDIGENYIQDSIEKFDIIGRSVKWHMIGHLQSNKAKQAVEIFDLVQSVDSVHLASEIGKRSLTLGKTTSVLVEVNISGEESKFGVSPEDVAQLCEELYSISGVRVEGLMGIAPFVQDKDAIRKSFAQLRELWERLPLENRIWLSMGMTSDYEIAIEEGSNMVRIGTAIFGAR